MKAFFKRIDIFGERGAAAAAAAEDSDGEAPADTSAKGMARQWNRNIKREMRHIDRDVVGMSTSEKKTVLEIKKLAAKKEMSSVKILAKELVMLRRSRDRMILTKTQLNSISNQLTQQVALAKLSNCFEKSAEVMQAMSKIINVPEVHEIMTKMGKEMENMGLIEGIMGDAIDETLADIDTEEQSELEIRKLLEELAIDNITLLPTTSTTIKDGNRATEASRKAAATAGEGVN
jgi:division protein CdvB (Snf7/Vps24/ESCRT-III family)